MHVNNIIITTAFKLQLIIGIPIPPNINNREFCEGCALAKSTRISSTQTPGSQHQHQRQQNKHVTFPSSETIETIPPTLTPTSSSNNNSSSSSSTNNNSSSSSSTPQPTASETSNIPTAIYQSPTNTISTSFATDLKGPLVTAINGAKYCLIFTSIKFPQRYRFAYFLKTKDQTIHYLQLFLLDMQAAGIQHNNIMLLKTDNGGEFTSTAFEQLCVQNKIKHITTSPYNPHQNGIAERTNRTVFELAFAAMYNARTPSYLWPYAVKAAIHILNILPNSSLNMESSPYYQIHQQPANITHLRVFGCDCYANIPETQRTHFGLRAIKATFLGYDQPQSLAYYVYYNKKVYKSGHVTFNEDINSRQTIPVDPDLQQLYQQTQDDSQQEATNELIPHLWNDVQQQGQAPTHQQHQEQQPPQLLQPKEHQHDQSQPNANEDKPQQASH
jgi:IS30 family transposase